MRYCALVGSRCYGLETAASDHDYLISGEATPPIPEKYCFRKTPVALLDDFLLTWAHPYALMPLFSPKIDAEEELLKLVTGSREGLVSAYRKRMYYTHLNMAKNFMKHDAEQSDYFAKLHAYALLWLDTLARYAAGEDFIEASKPSADMLPFLQKVRARKTTALRLLASKEKKALAAAESLTSFYDEPEDKEYITEFAERFKEITGG